MNNDSWIIIADGQPSSMLSTIAKGLGGQVTAVVAGTRACAETVAASGVNRVLWYATDDTTPPEAWMDEIVNNAVRERPRLVLAANLPMARVLVGAVAAKLGAVITSSIISVSINRQQVKVRRLVADERAVETLVTDEPVAGMITEGGEEAALDGSAEIISMNQEAPGKELRITNVSIESGGADLASADRVVGVGAGIGSKENIVLAEKLAVAFQAELACSLPLCDNYRWFEHSRVVGSSTQKISPRIYLMVGISGQPQHMAGVRGAKTIVAVNSDPEAPVFKKCNYGIVGDLNRIVPLLTVALQKYQGNER